MSWCGSASVALLPWHGGVGDARLGGGVGGGGGGEREEEEEGRFIESSGKAAAERGGC